MQNIKTNIDNSHECINLFNANAWLLYNRESWYGALCQMKGVPLVTLPLMMYTIFINGGFMVAVKYGTIMATTGICITQYKKSVISITHT